MSTGDDTELIGYEIADLKEFPIGQVDEMHVEDFTSFFNHTFSRPEAPDDKNWRYSAGVTKQNSEIELDGTEILEGRQRGNYPPGSEAIAGMAFRVTAMPTGGAAYSGYFIDSDDDNIPDDGFGFGADDTGTFAFIAKRGTLRTVYQDDWNGPDSIESDPFDKHYPRICRFPHLFYGGGEVHFRILDHQTIDDSPAARFKTVHIETPETVESEGAPFNAGPPFDQPNLPITFATDGISGGALRANAAHYESGEDESESRVNGEHFTGVSAGDSGWTHVISWEKRTDWEPVNVKPHVISVAAATNDAKLALQLDPTLSSTSYSTPTNSSSDETAVEVSTAGTLDSVGERRWVGYVSSGQGNKSSAAESAELDFNLPVGVPVALVAQGVGGSADLNGVVKWEEFF